MTQETRGTDRAGRRAKRFLTPLQKYEIFLQLVRQEVTVIEADDQWQVDRGVVMRIRTVAKEGALEALAKSRPGRPGERARRETSTQIEIVFTDALSTEGLFGTVERRADGRVDIKTDDRPVLLAVSDNGAQMTSGSTREFMALCAIAPHFGRPGTPTDQAWIESFNGHLKAEYPHLERITDIEVLRHELDVIRPRWNGVRLYAGIGYVTPDDEHEGRGPAIRKAREAGLEAARLRRLAYHRSTRSTCKPETR